MKFKKFCRIVTLGLVVGLSATCPSLHADLIFETVALTDLPAPGLPGAANYSHFVGFPAINDSGQVVFKSHLAGVAVDNTNDFGVFSGFPENLSLVMREGDQAPGFLPGVVFSEFADVENTLTDANGNTAFVTFVTGTGMQVGQDWPCSQL